MRLKSGLNTECHSQKSHSPSANPRIRRATLHSLVASIHQLSGCRKRKLDQFLCQDAQNERSETSQHSKARKFNHGSLKILQKLYSGQGKLLRNWANILLKSSHLSTCAATKRKRLDSQADELDTDRSRKRAKINCNSPSWIDNNIIKDRPFPQRLGFFPSKSLIDKQAHIQKPFPFLHLPIEIQRKVFGYSLVADAPIQPIDLEVLRRKEKPSLQHNQKTPRTWRRPLGLNVAVLRTCKHLCKLGKQILYSNTIDLSETEHGAMSTRRFRKTILPTDTSLVRHIVVSSRMIGGDCSDLDRHYCYNGAFNASHLRRAQRNADKRLEDRLLNGSIIGNIAKSFAGLQTLEIRTNAFDWVPELRKGFVLFAPCFKGITVMKGMRGSSNDRAIAYYRACGGRIEAPEATDRSQASERDQVCV